MNSGGRGWVRKNRERNRFDSCAGLIYFFLLTCDLLDNHAQFGPDGSNFPVIWTVLGGLSELIEQIIRILIDQRARSHFLLIVLWSMISPSCLLGFSAGSFTLRIFIGQHCCMKVLNVAHGTHNSKTVSRAAKRSLIMNLPFNEHSEFLLVHAFLRSTETNFHHSAT